MHLKKKKDLPGILLSLTFRVYIPKVLLSACSHEDVTLTMGDKGWRRERSTLRFWENNVVPGTGAFNEKTNGTGGAGEDPVL